MFALPDLSNRTKQSRRITPGGGGRTLYRDESEKHAGNEEQRRHANLGSQEVRAPDDFLRFNASVLTGGLRRSNLCHRNEESERARERESKSARTRASEASNLAR